MKITRLRRGYTIRLSDSEFEALWRLHGLGISDLEAREYHRDNAHLDDFNPAARRGLKTIGGRDAFRVADDRRAHQGREK